MSYINLLKVALRAILSNKFRSFLSMLGTSYNTYLTDQKLAFARKRLQLGFTVAEASEEAGFTSPSYFIQLYKKKYGQTPAKSLK